MEDSKPAANREPLRLPAQWLARLQRTLRHLGRQFGLRRVHRFEVWFMRVFMAVIIYQSLPLGAPYTHGVQLIAEKAKPGLAHAVLSDPARDNALRPPFLPISQMLPNSQGALTFTDQPKPNGLAHWIDFTFFSEPAFIEALPLIALPCLVLYALGWGLPAVLPILTFLSIGSRTLYNSQGFVHHGYQMLTLVLLAQTLVVLWACFRDPAAAFGLRRAKRRRGFTFWDAWVRYSQYMIIACYTIAGVVKPIKSDGEWFANSHFIGIQLIKTDRQNYYSDLDPAFGKDPVPYAAAMLEHPNLTRAFLGMGVLLEIFAFLALYSRFAALVMGLLFVLFHYFNEFLMHLYFYNNEKLVWVFLVNLPFWCWWVTRRAKRWRAVGSIPEPAEAAA